MAELTEEQLQEICIKIQQKEKTDEWFGVGLAQHNGRWYYNVISIYGKEYLVNYKKEIIF